MTGRPFSRMAFSRHLRDFSREEDRPSSYRSRCLTVWPDSAGVMGSDRIRMGMASFFRKICGNIV